MSDKDRQPVKDPANGRSRKRNKAQELDGAWTVPVGDRRPLARRITLGLMLILLGVVFLIANLTPNISLGKLWPIFIIAWGLARLISGMIPPVRFLRITHGLLIGAVGAILLCNTFEILPFSFWFDLLSLWPVLLIVAGIAILGKVLDSKIISALSPVIVLAALLLSFFYHGVIFKNHKFEEINSNGFGSSFSKPYDSSISDGVAELKFPAGRLHLGATDKLYIIKGIGVKGSLRPRVELDRSGSSIRLSVKPGTGFPALNFTRNKGWNVSLSKDILWTINADAGISNADIDLSELKVRKLDLNGGISDTTVKLGDNTEQSGVAIDTGVSNMRVLVPKSSGIRLVMDGALSSKNFTNVTLNTVEENGRHVYETPGYDNAPKRIELDVDTGVLNLTVEAY
jgi:hypothetical protein